MLKQRSQSSVWSLVLLGGLVLLSGSSSCSKSTGGSGNGSGGDGNGSGGDNGSGGNNSSGGSNNNHGGSGGSGNGGQGGSNAGQGGANNQGGSNSGQGGANNQGGSNQGGSNAGMGGMMSSMGGASNVPSFPPSCTARDICGTTKAPNACGAGDDPHYVNCGPAYGTSLAERPLKANAPAFCNSNMYAKDGIFQVGQNALDATAVSGSAQGTNAGTANVPGNLLRGVYQPPGYANAADGKVALFFLMDAFGPGNGSFKVEQILDHLIAAGEIPYTLAVFLNVGNDGGVAPTVISNLKQYILPRLKTMWPKISDDPAYRVIIGQSTAGAAAFDVMWLGTDVVAKGIGGSPSFACFMCIGAVGTADADNNGDINDIYQQWITACPLKPLRWTATVGTCDIFGSCPARMAAGCSGCDAGGQVDSSNCGATWLNTSRAVTNAFKNKSMPYQLFEVQGGGHTPSTWGGVALAEQLRWVFRDITCFQ